MPVEKDAAGQTGAGGRSGSWQGLYVRRGRQRVRANRWPWTVTGWNIQGLTMPMKSPAPSSWPRTPQGRCGRVVHGIVWVPAHLVLESYISVPPTGEFHASAKFLMLMLPHFFSSLFNYTRHSHSFMSSSGGSGGTVRRSGSHWSRDTRSKQVWENGEVTQRPEKCQEMRG